MVLKFDDVIYKRDFQIKFKDIDLDITVKITDKESEELSNIMVGILQGKGDNGRINEILFKDKLDILQETLIGFNFTKFQKMVLGDFENFMQGSINEGMKKVKEQ